MKEVLQCQAGHTFKRTIKRGRKPIWCPKHKPVIVAPIPSEDRYARAARTRAKNTASRQRTEDSQAVVWLAWLADEAASYWNYVEFRSEFGWKDPDTRAARETWKQIFQAAPPMPGDEAFKRVKGDES